MSISPRSPETSSTGEHYDRAALSAGVIAVTGVMDFLRLAGPVRLNEVLAALGCHLMPKCGACGIPVDDVEWSSRQRGAHRAPGQTIGSYNGPSTTAGPPFESLVNHLS